MINLRYHIVSLTAVFLAIGIGLTLGSTFLDRATVDNLNGQLESLEGRLGDRETRIGELEGQVDRFATTQSALDEQGRALLVGRLTDVPVMVLDAQGADEEDVNGALQALAAAGADVQGTLTITDRFRLDDEPTITDLASLIGNESADPSRLRRTVIASLGGELRTRQLLGIQEPAEGDAAPDPAAAPAPDPTGEAADAVAAPQETSPQIALVDELVASGFLSFEAAPGGPDTPMFPAGTRLLIVGGSSTVPDDLVIEPLLERMARATTTPVLGVVSSGLPGDGQVGDAVAVIRENETLRELISTVDSVEHFAGQAAVVLALADIGDGIVGHYGLGEGASQLIPPLQPT